MLHTGIHILNFCLFFCGLVGYQIGLSRTRILGPVLGERTTNRENNFERRSTAGGFTSGREGTKYLVVSVDVPFSWAARARVHHHRCAVVTSCFSFLSSCPIACPYSRLGKIWKIIDDLFDLAQVCRWSISMCTCSFRYLRCLVPHLGRHYVASV